MSKLDKFNLVTAIIGLVADIIGISVFLTAINTTSSPTKYDGRTASFIQFASIFLFLYGWLAISWIMIRRSFLKNSNPKWGLADTAYRTILGIGLLLLPLIVMIWINIYNIQTALAANSQGVNPSWTWSLLPSLIIFGALGSIILLVIISLMPIIYTEMPREPIEHAFRRPFNLLEGLFKSITIKKP
ncbi:MAG: hypothetical protein IH588_08605 [Anaerolineales bacterium]|nr:hypothetical protein [Anaerolineales bacterium]